MTIEDVDRQLCLAEDRLTRVEDSMPRVQRRLGDVEYRLTQIDSRLGNLSMAVAGLAGFEFFLLIVMIDIANKLGAH